jgi:hypothetical protein
MRGNYELGNFLSIFDGGDPPLMWLLHFLEDDRNTIPLMKVIYPAGYQYFMSLIDSAVIDLAVLQEWRAYIDVVEALYSEYRTAEAALAVTRRSEIKRVLAEAVEMDDNYHASLWVRITWQSYWGAEDDLYRSCVERQKPLRKAHRAAIATVFRAALDAAYRRPQHMAANIAKTP